MNTWRSKWSNLHAIGDKSLSLLISIYKYIYIYHISEITSTYTNRLHVFLHCSKIMLFRRPDAQSPHTFLHDCFLKLKIYTVRWLQTHSHKPPKTCPTCFPDKKTQDHVPVRRGHKWTKGTADGRHVDTFILIVPCLDMFTISIL